MKRKEARLIELYHTLPVRSLRTLLDYTTFERDANGAPAAGMNKLARAREVLNCWLEQGEEDLQLSSNCEQNEFHREQEMIGVCPECDQNDGIVIVRGDRWVVCHEHFVRWKAEDNFLDFYTRKGFTVVTAAAPGVLRYTEIEFRLSRCLAPSKLDRLRFNAWVEFAVWKTLFVERVLKFPVRLLQRIVWCVCSRVNESR